MNWSRFNLLQKLIFRSLIAFVLFWGFIWPLLSTSAEQDNRTEAIYIYMMGLALTLILILFLDEVLKRKNRKSSSP